MKRLKNLLCSGNRPCPLSEQGRRYLFNDCPDLQEHLFFSTLQPCREYHVPVEFTLRGCFHQDFSSYVRETELCKNDIDDVVENFFCVEKGSVQIKNNRLDGNPGM